MSITLDDKIKIRACVNDWLSEHFPTHRKYLCHWAPRRNSGDCTWLVELGTKNLNGKTHRWGSLVLSDNAEILDTPEVGSIVRNLDAQLSKEGGNLCHPDTITGPGYQFARGDGVQAAGRLEDGAIDLLLTDPPYGISKSYICEQQIPRRLRKDGRDFIMPKGNFGYWDSAVVPEQWLQVVLPKVGGWAVIFCGQAQIGEYQQCLRDHQFSAVGAMVWQKTNPVPFNAKFKPVNAWEAIVVGKRPGTKFNGNVVHNVFVCKSPSPHQRIHPTQKPLDLMEQFVDLFSNEGDFVYDPFGGAATTLIAAASKGRKARSWEMDKDIYQKSCRRIKTAFAVQ